MFPRLLGVGCVLTSGSPQSSTGSFSQKLWLGVAATSVSLYRQGEAEALESFPYGQICSYGVSDSNTFRITAGDRDLLFETTKVFRHPPPVTASSKSVNAALLGFITSLCRRRPSPPKNTYNSTVKGAHATYFGSPTKAKHQTFELPDNSG